MVFLRMGNRRRAVFVSGIFLLAGSYWSFLLFSQMAPLLARLPHEHQGFIKYDERSNDADYTLPSLDDVIKSEVDLDLQRVLANFKKHHEEVTTRTTPLKIIIASTWRSGSTLVGEILSSYPGAFYHYEPLMMHGVKQIIKRKSKEALDLLKDLLNCNYVNKTEYLKYAYGNPEIFIRNTRLWSMCSSMPRFKCYVPENISKLCTLFPLQVMKLVRVRLSTLAPLLKNKNTKILWLTRDPRAVMNSRQSSVTWCTERSCKDPKFLCNDLSSDFSTFSELNLKYPEKIMILRYEDFIKDPYYKTQTIVKFLGLPMHQNVHEYLKTHLSGDYEAPWSTIRDPAKQSKKWIRMASWTTVVNTQYYCRSVMKLLGYRPFDSQQDLVAENALQILNIQR